MGILPLHLEDLFGVEVEGARQDAAARLIA